MRKKSILNSQKEKSKLKDGQVILEFTFCMIVLFFMIYGVIMVFRWTGVDLAERRRAHTRILTQGIDKNWHDLEDGPMKQIRPYFFSIAPMNATQSPY